MLGTSTSSKHHTNGLEVINSYIQLTKPRIIPLLLITTAAAMWVASHGQVDPLLLAMTLLGGTLSAASAQAINCIYDRDIDYDMVRTRDRPIPSGRIKISHAIIFAVVLGILSFAILAIFANVTSALLSLSGLAFYTIIYTHFLKRHSTQNIVIGGAAGAIPPLVGWAAVTGGLDWCPWVIFAIIFLWTPPHFWALALMIKEDYAQVKVPMLPVVAGEEITANQIWLYTAIVVPFSFVMIYPLHASGLVYGLCAFVLGVIFLKKSWELKRSPKDNGLARSLFKYSILYMMLLCTGIVVDSLSGVHQLLFLFY